MDVYIYQAAIYCEDCRNPEMEGPHSEGGGEADAPQHCDTCKAFLENPLTADGYDYVREQCFNAGTVHSSDVNALMPIAEWAEFYGCYIPDFSAGRFDRFDICLAHYVFACEYYTDYSEQCKTLQRLARMQYKPGLTDSSRRMLENPQENENALDILARLVRNQKATEVQHA